jgi:hypothetical protein
MYSFDEEKKKHYLKKMKNFYKNFIFGIEQDY